MQLNLKMKKAFVLGSSSGLGKAIALKLAAEGAAVVIAGRDESKLQQASKDTGAVAAIAGDLTIPGEPERMVREAAASLGGLDIIVINSGGGGPGTLGESTNHARENAYHAMLRPAIDAATAAIPFLRESHSGRMLFVTSRSVVEATTELALSSVYRSGVAAAARSLALELAPKVLVNVIVPGQFDTPAYHKFQAWLAATDGVSEAEVARKQMSAIPLGRLGTADELADVVTFYCSERSSFVTGTVIRVDGGAVVGFH
ncbi:MAG: SDR family oxidoreductase [Gammaproteobacteria bacterium]|nr:SDR family oxidoreductase [Gammaproteobacteria bacterium]